MSFYTPNNLIQKVVSEKKSSILMAIAPCLWSKHEKVYVEHLLTYLNEYSKLPEIYEFKKRFPAFPWNTELENVEIRAIFDNVSKAMQNNYINENLKNPPADRPIKDYLEQLVKEAYVTNLNIIDYNTFDRAQFKTQIKRLETGLVFFDDTFQGLFPGEVSFIFGRMKSMKTTVLQLLITSLLNRKANILLISQELSPVKFTGRVDALQTGINSKYFRTAEFDAQMLEKLSKLQQDLSISSNTKGRLTISGRVQTINDIKNLYLNAQVKPDVIFIDAVELIGSFSAKEYHLSLAEVAYGLQTLALDFGVPIVGTLQANRGAANEELSTIHVAGSDAFARACEWLVGTSVVQENGKTYIHLQTIAYRDGELKSMFVLTDFDKMKFEFQELTAKAASEAIAKDEDAQENLKLIETFDEAKHRVEGA